MTLWARCIVIGVLAAWPVLARAQQRDDSTPLARGLSLYRQNRLTEALPLFERAIRDSPADPERLNWFAETQRRLGEAAEAVRIARQVAATSPCNSFTFTILGTAYSPQYSIWDDASYDSTWTYLRRAVACDTTDGNAWLTLWGEALRRGDVGLVQKALQALVTSGFLTPPTLELATWTLNTVPPRAVVLTGGDMDTYPLLAVQITEGIRPDVAIVNLPMLALPWYSLHTARSQGLPLPVTEDSLVADAAVLVVPADLQDSVVALWRREAANGRLGRPMMFGLGAGRPTDGNGLGSLQLVGGGWVVLTDSGVGEVDGVAVPRALAGLDAERWNGPALSAQDRSAVRRAYQVPPATYPLIVAREYSLALVRQRRFEKARQALRNAEAFAATAGLDSGTVAEYLREPHEALRSKRALEAEAPR